ncbi:unnamed protein product, partial [Amoebophrya sp. A25]|eukprot:GSA25T00013295001.1
MAYYALLEAAPDASEALLRRQYKKLARQKHPDKIQFQNEENTTTENTTVEEATAAFQKLKHAYEVLMKPAQRRLYDHLLHFAGVDAAEEDGTLVEIYARHLQQTVCETSFVEETTELMRLCETGTASAVAQALARDFPLCKGRIFSTEGGPRAQRGVAFSSTPNNANEDTIYEVLSGENATGAASSMDATAFAMASITELSRQERQLKEYVDRRAPESGRSAVLHAMRHKEVAERRRLIDLLVTRLGADVNVCNCGGFTPLMFACGSENVYRDPGLVAYLLSLRADVNAQTNYGLTALMIACCHRRRTSASNVAFEVLLAQGQGRKAFEASRLEPGEERAEDNHLKGERFLSKNDSVDVKLVTDVGFDALAFAADYGNYQQVERLLQRRADVNLQYFGKFDRTALMCSAALGNLEVISVLLKHKADPKLHTREASGAPLTAFDYAGRSFDDGLIVPHGERLVKVWDAFSPSNDHQQEQVSSTGSPYFFVSRNEGDKWRCVDLAAWRRSIAGRRFFDGRGRCCSAPLLLAVLRGDIEFQVDAYTWDQEEETATKTATSSEGTTPVTEDAASATRSQHLRPAQKSSSIERKHTESKNYGGNSTRDPDEVLVELSREDEKAPSPARSGSSDAAAQGGVGSSSTRHGTMSEEQEEVEQTTSFASSANSSPMTPASLEAIIRTVGRHLIMCCSASRGSVERTILTQ